MDKRIQENRRVKNQIATSYLNLLKNSTLEDAEMITISQITSKARVSRMAYYRNFKSKTDIVEYYLSESLWVELLHELSENFSFWTLDYGIAFFTLMKKHREDILLLKNHGYADLILSSFNSMNEELIGDMPQNSIERFEIYYAAGASYNAMLHWLEEGCRETAEEMAEHFFLYFGKSKTSDL